jgi:hypothetical protein
MAQAADKIRAKIRLFVEAGLGAQALATLGRDPAHSLFGVLRLRPGDAVPGDWA